MEVFGNERIKAQRAKKKNDDLQNFQKMKESMNKRLQINLSSEEPFYERLSKLDREREKLNLSNARDKQARMSFLAAYN